MEILFRGLGFKRSNVIQRAGLLWLGGGGYCHKLEKKNCALTFLNTVLLKPSMSSSSPIHSFQSSKALSDKGIIVKTKSCLNKNFRQAWCALLFTKVFTHIFSPHMRTAAH